ncbi:MAG: PAS domain S-box protein [Desulfobulbaceae bacterium]|nr:PAS domain S-box protein [Desulfobulbaceae bacterium]
MRLNSITFKLLAIIIGAFVITTGSVLFMAGDQLTRIIDESQHELFEKKTEAILGILYRSNERLKKTGLAEAYGEDFKEASLKILRQTYYTNIDHDKYPFIIDTDGKIVMHPVLPDGDRTLMQTEFVGKMLASNHGGFDYTYLGQKKWCHFLKFPEWNWVVGYTITLDVKYGDARKFRNLLVYIMGGVSLLVLLVLSLLVTRFTRPIVRLTNISKAMADGDLDQQIDPGGADEVGTLARSFSHMRDSIREKISELEEENIERSKAEEKLVQQNEYINSILESVTHPLYAIDVNDYTIKIANSASGIKAGDTSTCYAFTHRRDSPCQGTEHPCPLEIIKETKKPTMVEHIHFDKNGNKRNIEVYAYPVFDRQGELVQMIEYGIDVTERQRAQNDLAAEKERLSVTMRSIGDGVITTDISGNVVLLNKVAENLMGWSNEEAVGRPLEEVFHIINEQTREVCENPVSKVISSGQIVGMANHTVLVARDGTERSIADSGAPILDTDSKTIGVVLVFRDVTEQIQTEKELLKVIKLESVGVLAGGIAHDFNNILAAILGNINLALFDVDLKDETKKLLSEAEKATLRAKDLTQQLLTFAKGGEPVKKVSSLEDVIKDSANFVLHGDKVACSYDVPEDLWLVDIDRGQISQVVQNIVLNASHAMPEGGTVKVTCENVSPGDDPDVLFLQERSFVKLCIQDSGIGIPANIVEKIFDPYFTSKDGGSGLGLAITQSIINKHNGHIRVKSSPGVGSTFTIYLPASGKTTTHKQESLVESKAFSQAKIMIMDDDEMVRNVAQKMLVQLGHDVVLAANGEEAVKLYQESMNSGRHFDLVIMDLTIPGGMGGKEAVQEVLDMDPEAKVIVSSGYSNDPVMANFKDHGFCSAIEKPFRLQELSNAIAQINN